jgi:hypothetical protein
MHWVIGGRLCLGFVSPWLSYIILSVIKAALDAVHGAKVVENEISGYYLSEKTLIFDIFR